ncbi:carbohydrate ABC transporter permease [Dictyobacter arantiisoli]|uniref:ABC transporter permease n=1 Tax=Dictyobacter arantiisoli TaxID=2014874 RepID=A0A5A5T807_9CHLR|nr:carbohydrate ABC transporter permease [Dictyobacter arantiisoli]GCF07532.1 ABC transporter permease [Dictyobacter arantiisoli]
MAQTQATVRPTRERKPIQARKHPYAWLKVIVYLFLLIFTITSAGPLVFTLVSSFKSMRDVLAFPPTLLPNPFVWSNYQVVFGNPLFIRWLLNSVIYAGGATILNMLFSAMAGYALGRLNFPGKNSIFLITLGIMMIPGAITLIPKFLVVNNLHMANTFWALILPAMAQPFSVFLMVQFMKVLPKELEESAMIDGASRWRTFYQIILPQVKPALTAVVILTFQGAWNDFQWPLVALGTQNMYTLPLGLFFFKSTYYTQYNLLLAGSMFNTIPILILFFIFQRYFMEGAVSSGVKG